jgi:hypothetical protein
MADRWKVGPGPPVHIKGEVFDPGDKFRADARTVKKAGLSGRVTKVVRPDSSRYAENPDGATHIG